MPGSVGVRFTARPGGWEALLGRTNGPYGQWLTRNGNRMVTSAKRRANVDTGLMRSRVEFRLEARRGTLVGLLEARTNYALYVHEGVGGRPGNPFLSDAVREVLG